MTLIDEAYRLGLTAGLLWAGVMRSSLLGLALVTQLACDGGQAPAFPVEDVAACIEVDLSKFDQSCRVDSDCTIVVGGAVGGCSGGACYNGVISASAMPSYRKALGAMTNPMCGDLVLGEPRCRSHTCYIDGESDAGYDAAVDGAGDAYRE